MSTSLGTERFIQDWRDWKATRERSLAEPFGYLSLVSLDWLEEQPRAYERLPGLWWQDADAAYFDPQGAAAAHEGEPIVGVRRFELAKRGAGAQVVAGDLQIEITHRSGGYMIRARDPKSPVLNAFRGVPAYEPDEAWVLSGTFEAFDEPRPTTVGAVVEGLDHVYVAPGIVRFEHDGAEHTLTAFNGRDDGLSILFTDGTSGVTTYPANRALVVPAPAEDGSVVLDFTRAMNMPCAFTDFSTCPLPPAGNRLPFAVEAGEKLPYERQG